MPKAYVVFRYQASRNRFDMFCTLGFLYFLGMFLIPIEFGYRSESPHVYSAEIAIMNEAISERPKTACPLWATAADRYRMENEAKTHA